MPSSIHHRAMTRAAVAGANAANAQMLAEHYCLYPDNFHRSYDEISPYMYLHNKVEFHYLPHTPVDEFYRYWDHIPGEGTRLLQVGDNKNLEYTESGFRFYLENSIACLKKGKDEDAWKFMGCLLHFLEDSAFGVHAMEGVDGTDIYVLDRMSGKDVAKYLCSIPLSEALNEEQFIPEIFAGTIEEAVPLLYCRCARAAASSRKALFDMALEFLTGKSARSTAENEKIMFRNAAQLACDTLATVIAIAKGETLTGKERQLADFEPFFYPIGGGGSFQLRKYALSGNTITFGVNLEAKLLYHLPEKFHSKFTVKVSGNEISGVIIEVVNHGEIERTITVRDDEEITIDIPSPGGVFGFVTRPESGRGELILSGGTFTS